MPLRGSESLIERRKIETGSLGHIFLFRRSTALSERLRGMFDVARRQKFQILKKSDFWKKMKNSKSVDFTGNLKFLDIKFSVQRMFKIEIPRENLEIEKIVVRNF